MLLQCIIVQALACGAPPSILLQCSNVLQQYISVHLWFALLLLYNAPPTYSYNASQFMLKFALLLQLFLFCCNAPACFYNASQFKLWLECSSKYFAAILQLSLTIHHSSSCNTLSILSVSTVHALECTAPPNILLQYSRVQFSRRGGVKMIWCSIQLPWRFSAPYYSVQ